MKAVLLALYRVRLPLFWAAAAVLIANAVLGRFLSDGTPRGIARAVAFAAIGVVALCLLLVWAGPRMLPQHPARVVASPVRGRWLALNSPASQVPSHGVRAYGQAYAVDLVHEPDAAARPAFGGAMMRDNDAYPAYGRPVHAMLDGTVVRASDWRRDHRARADGRGLAYMMIEGMLRELGGPGFIVGNHVIVRGDDGCFAAIAHLQRGSVGVRPGERVRAGDVIGRCGNSGNSSEPHVHAQLMDRASLWTAQGLPMAFSAVVVGESVVDGVPENGVHLVAHV